MFAGQRCILSLHDVAAALALIPVVVLGYLYSMSRTAANTTAAIQVAPTEDEELLEVGL